jgi:MFS family permease
MVAASALGLAVSPGPVAFYSIGVLMQPLRTARGWSAAQVSLTASILTASIFVMMPIVGIAVDRYGPTRVLLTSMVAFGIALALAGGVHTLHSLYLSYALIGICCAGANSLAYMHVLSAWFDRRRGLAIGIASAGMGIGFSLVPGYTQFLVDRGGPSLAYLGLAALVLLLGFPVELALLRNRPDPGEATVEQGTRDVESDRQGPSGASVRDALRMRQLWMIGLIFVVVDGTVYGVALHLVSIVRAIDPGSDRSILAATLFGLTTVVGRVFWGFLFDRLFAPLVAGVMFMMGAAGIALLAFGARDGWPLIASLLIGLCSGAEGDALAILVSRYFGLRAYGKLYGNIFAATMIGISAAPYLLGMAYEHFGGYDWSLFTAASLLAACAVLTIFLGPFPRYQAGGAPKLIERNNR